MHRIEAFRALAKSIEKQDWATAKVDLDQLAATEDSELVHDDECDCDCGIGFDGDAVEAIANARAEVRGTIRRDPPLPDIEHVDGPLSRAGTRA